MTPQVPRPRAVTLGFTLIEMLVVLAIVALLLSVATPRYFGSLEKGREVALQENLRVLRVTLDKFHADKGRYPETLDELVDERYLREVPLDPITESATTWVLVPPKEPDQQGVADVKSGASGTARDGRRFDAL
ncbi:MAG: prepilin-type N-terminal cleavage/methylation domain-containing protein [Burkholderiales bacterium]|nr:prepilin-type N-terminal cleavage/methylation domain-containing protein [Burkholderiales bacterium]